MKLNKNLLVAVALSTLLLGAGCANNTDNTPNNGNDTNINVDAGQNNNQTDGEGNEETGAPEGDQSQDDQTAPEGDQSQDDQASTPEGDGEAETGEAAQ